MKLVMTLCIALAACAINTTNTGVCEDDHCVCPTTEPCEHTCTPGGNNCHIQCAPNETCDVICAPGEDCHVEASQSSHATVDCNVACPLGGCTVSHCTGSSCVVACFGGAATITGTTASCP